MLTRAGVRLLPFFATPMLISPIAGAVSDRIGRRPVMATGLFLLTGGLAWAAISGSLSTSWVELDIALLIAGVGVSMALPTVPTAVLNAVAPRELGKASGINYMMQRLGPAVAIAVASAVFAGYGHLSTPASITEGFRPALAACAGFALLAALSALAVTSPANSPLLPSTSSKLAEVPPASRAVPQDRQSFLGHLEMAVAAPLRGPSWLKCSHGSAGLAEALASRAG